MKHLFIVNPVAGGSDKTEQLKVQLKKAFAGREGEEYEIYVTTEPMDAAREVKSRAITGEECRIYACGGDGTFNEVVCGAAGFSNIAVCPLPTGTGNDFCRMFGDEKDLYRDIDLLIDGTIRPIDLIECNGRYSANLCSVGVDARIGCNVHNYTHLPFLGGSGAYVASCIVEVFKGISTRMKIKCGDYSVDAPISLCCVCNGRYYGGGFNPSLTAMPDDGELDIFIAKGMHLPALAMNIGKYASGRSDEISKWITHLKGTELSIELEKPDVVNIDGEAITAKKINMRLIPGALNLVIPKGMKFFDGAEA